VQKLHSIKTIYFIFLPSFATLDGWLPIMHEIKKQKQNVRIIGVFPNPSAVNLANDNNILLKLSSNIFDHILLQRFSKRWFKVDDLKSVRKFSKISDLEYKLLLLHNVLKKRGNNLIAKVIWAIFTLFDWFRYSIDNKHKYDINSIDKNNACVFYDMCKHYSSSAHDIQNALGSIPRFSIFHGPIIRERVIPFVDGHEYPNTVAYLFSDKEKSFYQNSYHLTKKQMRVVGVPRHDPRWVDTIINYDNKLNHGNQWTNYIYLVGRALQWNIPFERKKEALESIKKLAFDVLNKKIIVRFHPKEKNSKRGDCLYYDIFGRDTYGEKWISSDMHSFSLGADCDFAVTLNSSVSTDMLMTNVPVIEYYNTDKLEGYNHNYSQMFKDKHGNPVTEFNYYGVVLPASNYEDLLFQANRIMSDRSGVVKELQSNYHDTFHYDNNVINNIVSDIESDIRI
jgi:hypothetical protein